MREIEYGVLRAVNAFFVEVDRDNHNLLDPRFSAVF